MNKIYDKPYTLLEKLEDKIVRMIEKNSVKALFAIIGIVVMFSMEDAEAAKKVEIPNYISQYK